MITIITKYDDSSTLDFLATKCEYKITISENGDGRTSELCVGKDAGRKARDIIDSYNLLSDNNELFPNISNFITTKFMPCFALGL